MSKQEYMEVLVKELNEAARVYEQGQDEIMSNFEYDAKYDELLALEKELGIILPNSPTQRAGYEILSELEKEEHPSPMLSLDKTKIVQELVDFIKKAWDEVSGKKHKAFLSWKLDGLTVVLTYKNGILSKAVTRGNGHIGEIITKNAKFFKGVPKKISFNGTLVIRGEAIIGYNDFKQINKERKPGTEPYKNPRNLASGTVRQLNTRITAKRNVQFKPFQLVSIEDVNGVSLEQQYNSYSGRLEFLKELGFSPVEGFLVDADDIPNKVEWFSKTITTNDFPSDGLVLVFDDVDYGISLGMTSKFPRYGIAFKWKDETEETTLREIEWSASRTGLLNPVAVFDTVEIEGTSVSRASVHNISYIREKKLGIGDKIAVYKANMIIPQISENLTKSDNVVIPTTCPCCGGKTKVVTNINTSTKKEIETLYCDNADCPAKHIGAFEQYVSRDAMNIVGLSTATIERLISQGIIKNFVDFYYLEKEQNKVIVDRKECFVKMLSLHDIDLTDFYTKEVEEEKSILANGELLFPIVKSETINKKNREYEEKIRNTSTEDLVSEKISQTLKDTQNYSLTSYMAESKFKNLVHSYFELHQNDESYNKEMSELELKVTELSESIVSNWEGFGDKSYSKLLTSIEKSKNVEIAKFIYSLGIPNVGKSTATLICESFNNDINKLMSLTREELENVDGIGAIIADTYVTYFENKNNVSLVEELLKFITLIIPESKKESSITGLTFVITGTLPTMGRSEAAKLIEQNGGKVSSSVSKKTDYLLAGEAAGSKLDKAKSLGVKIISEDELLAILQ